MRIRVAARGCSYGGDQEAKGNSLLRARHGGRNLCGLRQRLVAMEGSLVGSEGLGA